MRKMLPLLLVLALAGWAAGQDLVIDHNDLAGVASYSQDTMNAIAELKWFFQHASVGDNILDGLGDIYTPTRYKITYTRVCDVLPDPQPTRVFLHPVAEHSPTQSGVVYEGFYQTEGPNDIKTDVFDDSLTNYGWRYPAIDVAIMKYCYINAPTTIANAATLASTYIAKMNYLEQTYGGENGTKFVWTTMPTIVYRASDDPYFPRLPNYPTYAEYWNVQELIQEYNNIIRDYCTDPAHLKVLFDIADIETHDDQNVRHTIQWHDKTIEVGYPNWYWQDGVWSPTNNGHLIPDGTERMAQAWYAVGALLLGNQAPVAVDDEGYYTPQDTTLNVAAVDGVLANDVGSGLTAVKDTNPSHGSVTLNSNGSFVYTPTTSYIGGDSFTYHVTDGEQSSSSATVTITVGNHAPIAADDDYSINQDLTLSVSAPGVLGNDTDADSDPLTASQVTDNVDHGSLTLNSNGSFVYTPTTGYFGPDAFTYEISDGEGGTDTAVVDITVVQTGQGGQATLYADFGSHERNGQDQANGSEETYTFNQNYTIYVHFDLSSVNFPIDTAKLRFYQTNNASAAQVLGAYKVTESWAEDTLTGLDYPTYDATLLGSATALQSDTPAYFEIELNAATVESMRTGANYGFRVAKSSGSSIQAIYFNSDENASNKPELVLTGVGGGPGPNPPVAVTDYYTNLEDDVLGIPASGVLANDTDPDGDPITAVLVSGPTHGSLDLNADGSFVYTPNPNYDQGDSFTYRAYDGANYSDTTTAVIAMTAVNDAPVAANDSGYSVDQDSYVTISAPGVLANDTDIDSVSITAVNASDPAHGTVTLNTNGSFTYTPDAGYYGADSFTYQAYDGSLYSSAATVSITVNPTAQNQAPVAANDSGYSVNQDSYLTVSATGVLANDSDPDNDPITAVNASDPAHGTVTLNTNGSFTYTPDAGYYGADSFTYQAYDGSLYSSAATVSITVNQGGGTPTTLYSTADTYVTSANPTLNYGTGVSIQVRYLSGTPQRQSYVYFDLSGIAFTVNSATLRIYQTGTAASTVNVNVYAVASAWTETGPTWYDQPGPTGSSLGSQATRTTAGWIEIPLTASVINAMRSSGNYGLILIPQSGGSTATFTFDSREATNDPQLVLEP